MKTHPRSRHGLVIACLLLIAFVLVACTPSDAPPADRTSSPEITRFDDLVSAGLGLEGLRASPPEPADPLNPTPKELRQRAFYTHYQGLSAINTPQGLGEFVASNLPVVAGLEMAAWREWTEGPHRSRVVLQLPETFDVNAPCLVAAPASGSRGVYGALPLVAPWALPKGCAVVYTDKGAGSDYVDLATQTGVALNGQRVPLNHPGVGFVPNVSTSEVGQSSAVATAHAHSSVNVETHWGTHTLDAVSWALEQLEDQLDQQFSLDEITIIAAGLSNGGQAVLKALEADERGLLDAVVSVMPNITVEGTPHLYEYAAAAALYQPCALADAEFAGALPFANPMLIGFGAIRCQSLANARLLDEPTPKAAMEKLQEIGFDNDGLVFSAATVALDIWRTVLVNYASAYLQTPYDAMPCGYGFDAANASEAQKALWWATASGSPPGDGITLIEARTPTNPLDPHFEGLMCLHELTQTPELQASLNAIEAQGQWPHPIPVEIIHGQVDGLIPAVFSSRPYVAKAQASGMALNYQEIEGAQHFDAFLNALGDQSPWVAILPHGWAALDRAWQALEQ